MSDLPDYVLRNREHWDREAVDWIGPRERPWQSLPNWGDTEDQASSEFHLPISEWMRLFDDIGFEVLAYHEVRNPDPGGRDWEHVTAECAHHYPSEQVWRLRKRG